MYNLLPKNSPTPLPQETYIFSVPLLAVFERPPITTKTIPEDKERAYLQEIESQKEEVAILSAVYKDTKLKNEEEKKMLKANLKASEEHCEVLKKEQERLTLELEVAKVKSIVKTMLRVLKKNNSLKVKNADLESELFRIKSALAEARKVRGRGGGEMAAFWEHYEETITGFENKRARYLSVADLGQAQNDLIYLHQQVEELSSKLQAHEEEFENVQMANEKALSEQRGLFKAMQDTLLSQNRALKASLGIATEYGGVLRRRVDSLEGELAKVNKKGHLNITRDCLVSNDALKGQIVCVNVGSSEWPSQQTITTSMRSLVLSALLPWPVCANSESSSNEVIQDCDAIPQKVSMEWRLVDEGRFDENEVRFYFCELLVLIQQIHAEGRVYGHLEPRNVLIQAFGHVVLHEAPSNVPTETKSDRNSSMEFRPFDVKFEGSPTTDCLKNVSDIDLTFPTDISRELKGLIRGLLRREGRDRLGVTTKYQIRKQKFLHDVDWEKVAERKIKPVFVLFDEEENEEDSDCEE
ncbi:hypothetical protein HDU76_003764 [Blyttiomyces sp. JEL0837]|nr:hypothetical protein HDU76_003764 [Blyttiomyces sp. JEL0837]